jgi:hypothetical protein
MGMTGSGDGAWYVAILRRGDKAIAAEPQNYNAL